MSINTDLQAALAALKFRILCRRGTLATLDLASMHAGEFAMATDTESVYACFGAGRFKQIAGGGLIIKGVYATLAALQAAHPTGFEGDIYAAGTAPQHLYIWQSAAWTDMGAWNDMSLYATAASVANLAGTGRTTETVKDVGLLASLVTTVKTTIVAAINEIFTRTTEGWNGVVETFTYASPTTVTVAAGAGSRWKQGDRIRLTQTTVKYFSVAGVADTVLTLMGGTDFTLSNAAISAISFSRVENPYGFPSTFNYNPAITWTASVAPAGAPTKVFKFWITGNICHVRGISYSWTAGTAVTGCAVGNPVNAVAVQAGSGQISVQDTPPASASYCYVGVSAITMLCASIGASFMMISADYQI